jgi:zinc protease
MEERRMRTEDSAQAKLYEALMATAYQTHPYRHPVIGWMDDLKNMKVEDARRWYETWYSPNNATLVVAGDVDPAQVLAWAQQYFGPIPSRPPLPLRKPQQEPEQIGMKQVTVKAPAKLPVVALVWQAPNLRDPQADCRSVCAGDPGRRAGRPCLGAAEPVPGAGKADCHRCQRRL